MIFQNDKNVKGSGDNLGWGESKNISIAQVLDDWTPEDLKDANPVVVVNGGLARPDMVLSGFPTNGSLLRMMIQQPMGW